jgi:hypothetical protein
MANEATAIIKAREKRQGVRGKGQERMDMLILKAGDTDDDGDDDADDDKDYDNLMMMTIAIWKCLCRWQ